MAGRPFNVILLGDNPLLKEGLVHVLNSVDFTVVSSSSFSDGSLLGLLPQESEVLLIVDASEDFDAAISKIKPFKLNYPNGRVAVLVGRHQFHIAGMISAFHSGASAYLMNCTMLETLIKCLELVIRGETIVPPAMLTYLLNHSRGRSNCPKDDRQNGHDINENNREHDQEESGCGEEDGDAMKTVSPDEEGSSPHLSARQTAILRCLIEGDSNKVIARKMKIADATVKVHIKTILRKIGVENRTQAALWATRNIPLISLSHNGESMTNKFRDSGNPIRQGAKPDDYEHLSQGTLSSGSELREREIL
jgi:two-component system, NarL family, nitrate/nitrite response regulator NarL